MLNVFINMVKCFKFNENSQLITEIPQQLIGDTVAEVLKNILHVEG